MLTTRQAIKLASAAGFECQRQGTHQRWRHTLTGHIVTIPNRMKSETISKKIEKQIRVGSGVAA